jgi:hypothetical protein
MFVLPNYAFRILGLPKLDRAREVIHNRLQNTELSHEVLQQDLHLLGTRQGAHVHFCCSDPCPRRDEAAFFSRRRYGSGDDVVGQQSRLAELKREGIVTDDEFGKLKSRVMEHASDSGSS